MYLDEDNKIKLRPDQGDLEYLVDAYIKLEEVITDYEDEEDSIGVKEEICEHGCSYLLCEKISCQDCPFNIPSRLTLKTLELVVQEEYIIFDS